MVSGLGTSAAIVGIAEMPLSKGVVLGDWTVFGVQAFCASLALKDAGISIAEVDGMFCAGAWNGRSATQTTLAMAEYLGVRPRYTDSTNIGGASFEAHLHHASAAIEAGLCNVALITYGSLQRSQRFRTARAISEAVRPAFGEQFTAPFGLPNPIGAYALAANRHMAQFGTTGEQLAEVAVAAHLWGALNPDATDARPITVDDVVGSDLICAPLHRMDCCLVTDGGGAIVIVGKERAKASDKRPVWILGAAESHSHYSITEMEDLTATSAYYTSGECLRRAGLKLSDIDVFEIYDSFTITVLLTLEALGLCPPGEAGPFVEHGVLRPGGTLSVNTNGGGLAYAHPGMFGLYLLIEAVRQLRGDAPESAQVSGARTALVHATGGQLASASTVALATD